MAGYKLGFIGAGNMAEAIFSGILSKGAVQPEEVFLYDINRDRLIWHQEQYGVRLCSSEQETVENADIVFLAVKPHIAPQVLQKLRFSEKKALVSIVAGLATENILKYTNDPSLKLLRVMPNTPFMVGEGAVAFSMPHMLPEDVLKEVEALFSAISRVVYVEERLMAPATGINGSGPAYVYIFIEALADAGVKHGLPRETAQLLAAQTVLGAAKMVLETGKHPGRLKDEVCSPGGTTIEAVAKLEEYGLRNAVIKAVDACVDKANKL